MTRRPFAFRLGLMLVATWYAAIASGQLSLTESVVAATQVSLGQRMLPPMHQTAVGVGVDCHGASLPNSPKHLCSCIGLGCYQPSVALPVIPVVQRLIVDPPVRVSSAPQQTAIAPTSDYWLPPATAPPVA